jgi:hypothetical protein
VGGQESRWKFALARGVVENSGDRLGKVNPATTSYVARGYDRVGKFVGKLFRRCAAPGDTEFFTHQFLDLVLSFASFTAQLIAEEEEPELPLGVDVARPVVHGVLQSMKAPRIGDVGLSV